MYKIIILYFEINILNKNVYIISFSVFLFFMKNRKIIIKKLIGDIIIKTIKYSLIFYYNFI